MQDRSRVALPFQFNRGDIPYVPAHTRTTEMPTLTSAFTTRMTTREQARVELEATSMPRSMEEQLPTWMEYHQRHAQQLTEGRRAIEEIARNVVDASNEPDIHPDPHPLLGARWGENDGGPTWTRFEHLRNRTPALPGRGGRIRQDKLMTGAGVLIKNFQPSNSFFPFQRTDMDYTISWMDSTNSLFELQFVL